VNHLVSNLRSFAAVVAALLAVTVATPALAQTGTLRITFKYKGDAPSFDDIEPTVDKAFCGSKNIPDERLIVNSENQGLKNVVVYVYTGRRGTDLPAMDLKAETHELANKNCRFQPHVLIAKKGDTIKVTNPDEVGHNANFAFFNNPAQNLTVPVGGSIDIKLEEAEPTVIPVACNIHPWMKAQVLVLDHPFAAVSDENGVLEISGLPAGEEIIFRANHESGSMSKVILNGEEESWRGARFEVEIKPGMNDLGTVEIPADAFDL
jgi:plastocyanin